MDARQNSSPHKNVIRETSTCVWWFRPRHPNRSTASAQDIGKVIQNQIDSKGVFISRYLRNRRADVRSRDMTTKERTAFNQAAKNQSVEVLKEGDHLHLQF